MRQTRDGGGLEAAADERDNNSEGEQEAMVESDKRR